MVESSDKTCSIGAENGKPLQHSCLENSMNSMKRQKHMALKNELPRLVGAQYATGEEWRDSSRKKENHNHIKLTNLITWTTALSNSMKLGAMPCRATQDRQVMVESSDKMWSTGEGNGKPLQYSCFENPMNSVKRQKDRTLKEELPSW